VVHTVSTLIFGNETLKTDFRPDVDGWEFTNYGTYGEPRGICSGMSVAAMWYFKNIKNKINVPKPLPNPLYKNTFLQKKFISGVFPDADKVWMDNTLGLQFATTVQKFTDFEKLKAQREHAIDYKEENDESIVKMLWAYFKTENNPLYLGMYSKDKKTGHAVIAYGISDEGILISDPNRPGKERIVLYSNKNLLYKTSSKADISDEDYIYFLCFSTNFLFTSEMLENL
jgi:hypothetical protein